MIALVCSGTIIAAAYVLVGRYEDRVSREDILGDVPPAVANDRFEAGPLNFLLLGSDSTQGQAKPDDSDGSRSDTIMILHVSKGLERAFIFSIPRDSYVTVPAGGSWKGGKNKINAAFAFGGAKLAAKTVYDLTKIPLDGAMIVNFAGIHRMVAEVGTVTVCIPYDARSSHTGRVWNKGCHEMGPAETEDFVRQRKGVPGGDFGRMYGQQLVVKALADKISKGGMLKRPATLDLLIATAAESVTVDRNTNLRELVLALKDIDPDDISFATVPYVGTMTTEVGSSVRLDEARAEELFQAVREDRTDEWLAANPQPVPGAR